MLSRVAKNSDHGGLLAAASAAERLFFIGINGRLGTFSAGVIGWLMKEDQDIFSAQKKGSSARELPGSS
jgi:hypothetical protein